MFSLPEDAWKRVIVISRYSATQTHDNDTYPTRREFFNAVYAWWCNIMEEEP